MRTPSLARPLAPLISRLAAPRAQVLGIDNGFVKVSRIGEDGLGDPNCTGWVRGRNISTIKRQAGLPDLGELAQVSGSR